MDELRETSSSVISGNNLDHSPNANIINNRKYVDHLSVHIHYHAANSGLLHATGIDVSYPLDLIGLRAWLSTSNRTAQSRASSLPEIFAQRLTDSIAQTPTLQACALQIGQTLFLRGGMGVGKTTTVCGLIKHLNERGDVAVACMFVESEFMSEHDARKILMLFLQQVSDLGIEEHRLYLSKLIMRYPSGRPSADEAVETLAAIIKSLQIKSPKKTTCLFLDGLDEMEDKPLHELLLHLGRLQQLTSCGIVMASRVISRITERCFSRSKTLDITANVDDIQFYVDKACRGPTVKAFVAKDHGRVTAISEAVTAGFCGSFLLAILNTSHVTTVQNKQGFTKALIEVRNITSQSTTQKESVLEKTIFSIAFDRNIRRLSKCQDAGDILALVRDSGRQFRAVELCHILALRNGAEICDSEALLTEFDISDITQCLVTVGSDSFVNLVHPGLRVYLQHYGKSSKCPLDLSDKNSMLAQICMSYLSSQQFSNGACTTREDLTARISKSPFLDYAAKYWHRHYAEANKSGTDMALRNAALQFLSQDGPVSSARQIMSLSQPLPKGHEQSQTQLCNGDKTPAAANDVSARQTHLNTTGLHLAIQLRLDELAIILATGKNSSTINRTDGDGETPLHLAVALEANVVAQNLVHNGGDINAQNLEGFSPWHIATANGNLSVVRMFLKQPAEGLDMNQLVSPKEDQHQSQLVTTSNGSSARNEQTAYGATALHLAARNGHVEIVRRIISDARCKELIEDCSGMTEFHKACSYGQLEVVRLLIETSAKYVRHHSKQNGRIGFHLACKYEAGYEVAKFLLEAYPDLCRIPDNNGDVALHHAAIGGVVNTVQLLLQQPDININPRNKKGQTPLALAAEYDSAALCTLYDHEGVYRWISVMGRPVEEIVRQQREKHVDS